MKLRTRIIIPNYILRLDTFIPMLPYPFSASQVSVLQLVYWFFKHILDEIESQLAR